METMPEGQAIRHDVYGLGVVIASDSDRTAVHFEKFGRKLFVTGMMKAEAVGGRDEIHDPPSPGARVGASGGKPHREFAARAPRQCPFPVPVRDIPKYALNAAGRRLSRATFARISYAWSAERSALQRRDDIFAEQLFSTLRLIDWERLGSSLRNLEQIEEHEFLRFKVSSEVEKRLRRFREQRGLMRTELHRRSGVPLTSLEYYERGTRKPSLFVLEKICVPLGVRIDCFLEGGGAELWSPAVRPLFALADRLGWARWRSLLALMLAATGNSHGSEKRKPGETVASKKRDFTSTKRDHNSKKA